MGDSGTRTAKLIIFDLDGTLVDSRRDIAASINVGLERIGGIVLPEEEIFALIGRPLDFMFETLLPKEVRHRAPEASAVYREHYFDHCAVHTTVFSGVIECLDALSHLRLAIATTKATFQAVRVIQQLGLERHFELVQGCDGIPHKPDPAVVNQVLSKLGVSPSNAWMVGDTTYDIDAGKAAGLRTCAVTYGIGAREDLERRAPDLVLDDLAHFPLRVSFGLPKG